MEKNRYSDFSEVVFSAANSQTSRAISKALKAGKLRKIAPRIYTSNFKDSNEVIVQKNRFQILAHLFPGAVISHRSALEGGFSSENTIFLTYKYTKKIILPGITVHLLKGKGALPGDNPFMDNLYYASYPRAYLENMQSNRQRDNISKALDNSEIEGHLERYCSVHGFEAFNKLRDDARNLADLLEMQLEFKKLNNLMGGIIGSRKTILTNPAAIARAKGIPYDPSRLEVFAEIVLALRKTILTYKKIDSTPADSTEAIKNLAFFEAYFSNYIEGTKFQVEEAIDIIFHHKILPHRQDDSHDILGTFRIVADIKEMQFVPKNIEDFFSALKRRHFSIMEGRPDKKPGIFKEESNQAGNTLYVMPELVRGTLLKGFEMYLTLEPGISRAIFMMFLVAEVHPFLDGNGRLARIMMNAELVNAQQFRIIIPTVYREDYLLSLKKLTHQRDPFPFIKMLLRAQEFTASIDFTSYERALLAFQNSNAFLEPFEGKLKF